MPSVLYNWAPTNDFEWKPSYPNDTLSHYIDFHLLEISSYAITLLNIFAENYFINIINNLNKLN